jgi:Protein of unknown function, DUF
MAAVERLTLEEVRLLKPWTQKLELLERGAFPANTEQRRHFLEVCRGQREPETDLERAYLKWRVSKVDLEILEADLLLIAAKAESLQETLGLVRESRDAAARKEKQAKRDAKAARLEVARRERRQQAERARRAKTQNRDPG